MACAACKPEWEDEAVVGSVLFVIAAEPWNLHGPFNRPHFQTPHTGVCKQYLEALRSLNWEALVPCVEVTCEVTGLDKCLAASWLAKFLVCGFAIRAGPRHALANLEV